MRSEFGSMRPRTYYALAIVSLILIILWLHLALLPQGGLSAILGVLLSINLFWLLPAFGLFGLSYIIRAVRWWILLRPFGTKGTPANLFPIYVGGIFLTYVAPLRAGDFAAPYWVREKRGTRFTAGLSAVLIERLVGFASLILLVMVFLILLFGFAGGFLGYLTAGALIGAAFLTFFLLIRNKRVVGFLAGLASRLFRPSKRLREEVPAFVEHLAEDLVKEIGSQHSGWAFLLSIPIWLLEALKLMYLGLAVGLPITPIQSCFVGSISYMGGHFAGLFVPAGIGIFAFQAATLYQTLLTAGTGATLAQVASIALLDGLVYVMGLTALGVPSIASMGRGYRQLQDQAAATNSASRRPVGKPKD
jgi:uncharacterized protein (TIRG00374 family)